MKVGFYDSGIGGLTIFREAVKNINAEYIYLGDNKNAPYGIKDKEIVRKYIFENVEFLKNKGCKIIVIACNTATSIAIKELRKTYKDICFIGTEPAVKKAVDAKSIKKILICATSITVKEEKLSNLISNLHANEKVDLISLDKLVEFAENDNINITDNKLNFEVMNYLKESLGKYDLNEYSYVVLGCTHFPLFKKEFKEVFGNSVNVIDGSIGVVNNLKRQMDNLSNNSNDEKICKYTLVTTKESKSFVNKFSKITKLKNFDVEIRI